MKVKFAGNILMNAIISGSVAYLTAKPTDIDTTKTIADKSIRYLIRCSSSVWGLLKNYIACQGKWVWGLIQEGFYKIPFPIRLICFGATLYFSGAIWKKIGQLAKVVGIAAMVTGGVWVSSEEFMKFWNSKANNLL